MTFCYFDRISVIAKKFAEQTDKKEKWYGTEYKLEPIAQSKLQVILYTYMVTTLVIL